MAGFGKKRFHVSLEFKIYDTHGGGICGSAITPGFRLDLDNLTSALEKELIRHATTSITDAFAVARVNAARQDHLTEVASVPPAELNT